MSKDAIAPPGVPGQLVHRGGCVAKGYWNAPEATAERFRQIDRFPGETVVFSGDLVRRDEEGYFYFLGANGLDDQDARLSSQSHGN